MLLFIFIHNINEFNKRFFVFLYFVKEELDAEIEINSDEEPKLTNEYSDEEEKSPRKKILKGLLGPTVNILR